MMAFALFPAASCLVDPSSSVALVYLLAQETFCFFFVFREIFSKGGKKKKMFTKSKFQ